MSPVLGKQIKLFELHFNVCFLSFYNVAQPAMKVRSIPFHFLSFECWDQFHQLLAQSANVPFSFTNKITPHFTITNNQKTYTLYVKKFSVNLRQLLHQQNIDEIEPRSNKWTMYMKFALFYLIDTLGIHKHLFSTFCFIMNEQNK